MVELPKKPKHKDYRKSFLLENNKLKEELEQYEEQYNITVDKKYLQICYSCKFLRIIFNSDTEFEECSKAAPNWVEYEDNVFKCGYFRHKDSAEKNLQFMHILYLKEIIEILSNDKER